MVLIKREPIDFAALVAERETFEVRYGVKSACLADAFRPDGHLEETDDFHRWSKIHNVIEKYGPRALS